MDGRVTDDILIGEFKLTDGTDVFDKTILLPLGPIVTLPIVFVYNDRTIVSKNHAILQKCKIGSLQ